MGCLREDDTVIELVDTKGDKPRTVPVNAILRKALQAWRAECARTDDHDFVFTARHAKPGEPLTANAVAAWFRDLYTRRLGWATVPHTWINEKTPGAIELADRDPPRRYSASRSHFEPSVTFQG